MPVSVFIAKANSQHLFLEGLLTIKKNKGIKKMTVNTKNVKKPVSTTKNE